MARKNATLADSDQIKDQVFSELQSLIEESEKLLNDSAALVGEEAETLRAQVSLKLKQARQAAGTMRDKAQPVVDATQDYIGGHLGRPSPFPPAWGWWWACCWGGATEAWAAWCESGGQRLRDTAVEAQFLVRRLDQLHFRSAYQFNPAGDVRLITVVVRQFQVAW